MIGTDAKGLLPRLALGLLPLLAMGHLSCADVDQPIRIGAKDFTEQHILAEMLGLLLADQAPAGVSINTCGDIYSCQRALQQGRLDLLVEYTGTGMVFTGAVIAPGQTALMTLRRHFQPLGLRWLDRLGFDNGYRVLVPAERALALGLRSISDLTHLKGGIRVACPPEYLRRPRDGLASLVKRYGLRLSGEPVVLAPVNKRFQALYDGRADVAIGYATDGLLRSLDLQTLEDNLNFYPDYDAVVVARESFLKRHPDVNRRLGRLKGRIDEQAMQQLNYRVQVEGWKPRIVARRFLQEQRLIKPKRKPAPASRALVVKLAVHQQDQLGSFEDLAVRSARQIFSHRPVHVERVLDPIEAVIEGKARLAVLGAERFFRRRDDLSLVHGSHTMPQRDLRLEAAAVLGSRMIHLIRSAQETTPKTPLEGKIGVGEESSGSAHATWTLLAITGRRPTSHGDLRMILERVAGGQLDLGLFLAAPGDTRIARALARGTLKLHSLTRAPASPLTQTSFLTPRQAMQVPYLRPTRIPAETYPGQSAPIETLGAQVLLAGPSRQFARTSTAGGPAAVFPLQGKPLTPDQVETLARSTRVPEAPDPALPSAWSLHSSAPNQAEQGSARTLLETLLNMLIITFIIWLGVVVMARHRVKSSDRK